MFHDFLSCGSRRFFKIPHPIFNLFFLVMKSNMRKVYGRIAILIIGEKDRRIKKLQPTFLMTNVNILIASFCDLFANSGYKNNFYTDWYMTWIKETLTSHVTCMQLDDRLKSVLFKKENIWKMYVWYEYSPPHKLYKVNELFITTTM